MLPRRGRDSRGLCSAGETSDSDRRARPFARGPSTPWTARRGEVDGPCVCEAGPRTPDSEGRAHTPDTPLCEHCGKTRATITRYSEGYGTEEECALSDPQGESDADADIEDTDCRLQEPGPLQRISSRRRKRPRVARQDTTESEDDGGRSHGSRRWSLGLGPDGAPGRTIPEAGPRGDPSDEEEGKRWREAAPAQWRPPLAPVSQGSVSQVRPLVVRQPHEGEGRKEGVAAPRGPRGLTPLCPSPRSLPVVLLLLLFSLAILVASLFLPLTGT